MSSWTILCFCRQRGVVDPKEAEKIIATAGGILRIEYIEKLMKAANDCESRFITVTKSLYGD